MANVFQSTSTGKPELKDNYENESTYEAVRRRRKKMVEKQGIQEDDEVRDQFPNPND